MSKLQVVIKRAGFTPEIAMIPGGDREVAAILEIIEADEHAVPECVIRIPGVRFGLACYANEEGKLEGLRPNFIHPDGWDVILGNVVWLAIDVSGEAISIPDEIAARLCELMRPWSPALLRPRVA